MNYKSIEDLNNDLLKNLHKIPRDIDLVVGVPRSGLLVANMIALLLNLQITDVDGLLSDHIIGYGGSKTNFWGGGINHTCECKKILVVEDSVYTGASLISVKKRIETSQLPCEAVYFAAYVSPGKEELVDLYLQVLPGPRIFEWNMFHSGIIEHSCVDIDGVLCVDPSEDENDDSDKYKFFLKNAAPKIIPTRRIKCVVSSRLEKFRNETEEWLEQNNVLYEKLYLLDSTAEERREKGLHSVYKSLIYSQSDCCLFIESSQIQAKKINMKTGKPVFCMENNVLYDGLPNSLEILPVRKKTLRDYLARVPAVRKIYELIKSKG